jgi:hypothetical protein
MTRRMHQTTVGADQVSTRRLFLFVVMVALLTLALVAQVSSLQVPIRVQTSSFVPKDLLRAVFTTVETVQIAVASPEFQLHTTNSATANQALLDGSADLIFSNGLFPVAGPQGPRAFIVPVSMMNFILIIFFNSQLVFICFVFSLLPPLTHRFTIHTTINPFIGTPCRR